jgi:membrane-bound lytic murein transglycosylase D
MTILRIRYFSTFLLLLCSIKVVGQTVPEKIEFAGMELILRESVRKDIQADVDALTRYPKYFNIKVDKANQYFPIIERIFREENVPDDFKFLVLQESALVPDAVSTSNAVGFWQFKKGTGEEVGLRIDRHIDERANIVSSTRGAAKYLKTNQFFLRNWVYSLLAYNTGRGGVEKHVDQKYIGANKMTLDNRTHWYVKKFLAHMIAFKPSLYNSVPTYRLHEFTDGSNIDLSQVADRFKVDQALVKDYNRWLLHGKIPSDRLYTVIVPMEGGIMPSEQEDMIAGNNKQTEVPKKETVLPEIKDNAAGFPKIEKNFRNGIRLVRLNGKKGILTGKDDDMSDLAASAELPLEKFLKFNDLESVQSVKEGHYYYLQRKRNKAGTHYHVFKPGETLWGVSQKYGIKLKKIFQKNRISSGEEVKAGRLLWLRFIRPEDVPIEYRSIPGTKDPVVKPQESGRKEMVAQNFPSENKSEKQITREKPADKKDIVQKPPAEEIKTQNQKKPVIAPEPLEKEERPTVLYSGISGHSAEKHTVQKGETYYSISRMYGITIDRLLKLNNLKLEDGLSIGQELQISPPENDILSPGESRINHSQDKSYIWHEVKPGETLYKIARAYQVTIKDLMDWNSKTDFALKVGEKLRILR